MICILKSVQSAYIHWITAGSIVWLWEPLSILQLGNQRCWVDARIGCLGSTEDLPAGHSKWPLHIRKSVAIIRNLRVCLTNVWLQTESFQIKCVQLLQSYGSCTTCGLSRLDYSYKSQTNRDPMHVQITSCVHGQILWTFNLSTQLHWQAVLQTHSLLNNWKWWKIFIIIYSFANNQCLASGKCQKKTTTSNELSIISALNYPVHSTVC